MQTPQWRGSCSNKPARRLAVAALLLAACSGEVEDGPSHTTRSTLLPAQVLTLQQSLEAGASDFGHAVAIGRELLAVGDPEHATVHVYRSDDGRFKRVTAIEGPAESGFGSHVAVSDDAVVVAHDPLARRVEVWAPEDGVWSVRTAWEPELSHPDAEFGSALYADDTTVIIGAHGAASSSGRVVVMEGSPSDHENWERHVLTALEPGFGRSLAFDGHWLVVGVRGESEGGVRTFERIARGDWADAGLLEAPDPDGGWFGETVAIADGTLFVGAPHTSARSAVHAYTRGDGGWQRAQTFEAADDAEHHFGSAIAATNELLVIGSRHTNEPVRYYRPEEGTWVEAGAIAEPVEFEKTHLFGWSLAADGTRVVVGSPGPILLTSPPSRGQGRAHVFAPGYAPTAPDQRFRVYEDRPLDFHLAATDADGHELSVRFSALAVGRLERLESGWRYAPGKNWHGIDSFDYTVTDPTGLSATGKLTFEIRPVNDAPVVKHEYMHCEELPCRLEARLQTADVDDDRIATFEIVKPPSHGRASIDRGLLTYELDSHPGRPRVSFEIRVSDRQLWSEHAVVDIIVGNPIDDPDLRRPESDDRDSPETSNETTGGCSSASGAPAWWALLAAVAFARRRR